MKTGLQTRLPLSPVERVAAETELILVKLRSAVDRRPEARAVTALPAFKADVGDMAVRTDTTPKRLYICTVAGNPGTFGYVDLT